MSDGRDDGNNYAATFAREEVEDRIAAGELETTKDVAILPAAHYQIERYLGRLDNPEQFRAFRIVHTDGVAKGVRRAVDQDDVSTLSYFRGWKSDEKDVSGIKSLTKLFRIITSPGGRILYVFGNQGAGKTDFTILVAELLHEFQDVAIHSNIKSLDQAEYFNDTEGLKDAIRSDERAFIILDEASRLLRGENHHDVVDAFKGDLHSLRKSDSNIALIGHSGKDIDPLFRALATFVHKERRDRVTLYEGARVTPEGRVEGYNELLSLGEIPPTNWDYDTNEESTFTFSDGPVEYTQDEVDELIEDELQDELIDYRNSLIKKIYEMNEDVSQRDLADYFELDQGTVSRIIRYS